MIDDRRRVLTWFLNLTASVVFVCNYIFYFSTVKVSNRLVNIVYVHVHKRAGDKYQCNMCPWQRISPL